MKTRAQQTRQPLVTLGRLERDLLKPDPMALPTMPGTSQLMMMLMMMMIRRHPKLTARKAPSSALQDLVSLEKSASKLAQLLHQP